jgi:creatinine amidohydrolase
MAYPEVERYLESKDTVLLPMGSTEQHSPYGLMGTDFIAAEAVARGAGDRLSLIVAPALGYGFSTHHMAFCGTVTLRPETLTAVVVDVVRSFLSHGFRRVVIVNGHGGNVASVQSAFAALKHENAPGIYALVSWYELPEVRRLAKSMFGDEEGQHATPSEVSICRWMRPEAFGGIPEHPGDRSRPEYHWPLSAGEFREAFPDGRMESAPWLATADHGKKLLEQAADAVAKRVEKCLQLPLRGRS